MERLISTHTTQVVERQEDTSGDLPMMSEALTRPISVGIHKQEAISDYKLALQVLKVPQEDIVRNTSRLETRLEPLTNGELRKGLRPVYAASSAAQNFRQRDK